MEGMRRFGHKGTEAFHGVGTNAKLSEFHAAMGLCNLNHLEEILEKRQAISECYDEELIGSSSNSLRSLVFRSQASKNFAYYPVIFDSEQSLLDGMQSLSDANVFARRYFYPDLSECFAEAAGACSCSIDVSKRILCLPLSASLSLEQARMIADNLTLAI
jgi:dTDP-4-amino-4,6-dideoxygalactose transaminase